MRADRFTHSLSLSLEHLQPFPYTINQINPFTLFVWSSLQMYLFSASFAHSPARICGCSSPTQRSYTVVKLRAPGTPHYLSHLSNWPCLPPRLRTQTHTRTRQRFHTKKRIIHISFPFNTKPIANRGCVLQKEWITAATPRFLAALHSRVSCRGW